MAGNWKLSSHSSRLRIFSNCWHRIFCEIISCGCRRNTQVVVFPPFPFLAVALQSWKDLESKWALKVMSLPGYRAFTGEVSASMNLRSMDATMSCYSERRAIFDESDEDINIRFICLKN
jgi:triosephosphate isomerase